MGGLVKAHVLGMPRACPQITRQAAPQRSCARQPRATVTRSLRCRVSKDDDLELVKKEGSHPVLRSSVSLAEAG